MGLLEDLSSGKYNLILIGIIFIFVFNLYWCISNKGSKRRSRCKDKKELMTNVSSDITAAINKIYKADVESIRNLANLSKKIQEGGLTIPGNLTVEGAFNYLPKGSIIAYNQTSAPKGWTLCDGSNGSPNLTNRFILGWGNRGINQTGGVETVTLLESHMPSHSHTANVNDPGHDHFLLNGQDRNWLDGTGGVTAVRMSSGNYGGTAMKKNSTGITVNIEPKGNNQPHENMPPFYVLTYIMKL